MLVSDSSPQIYLAVCGPARYYMGQRPFRYSSHPAAPVTDYREMLALDNPALARVDPLVRNLLVAKSIPALSHLDIPHHQRRCDEWSDALRQRLAAVERAFHRSPHEWKDDINFFRLGVLHEFVECELGIEYIEAQRDARPIRYTDPSDLFVNGVMYSRRGTCGNMAVLQVALGWRLGWPVSLAAVGSHFLLRYDDGKVTHNIEATQSGFGGFRSSPDEVYLREFGLPPVAVACGSDLRALSPRETVGAFVGLRARHMRDTGRMPEAISDYLLARWLYPNSRVLYRESMALEVTRGERLFAPGEVGSPESLLDALLADYGHGTRTLNAPRAFVPATRIG